MGLKKNTRFGVSTASGGAAFILGWATRSLLMLVLLVLLARLLKPADFGLYTIVIALYYIMEMIGYLSIDTSIRKKLPEINSEAKKLLIISNGFFLSEAVTLALVLATLIFAGGIANLYDNQALTLPIQVAAITVILSVAFNVASASLLGLRKNAEAAKANVAFAIGYLISAPLLVLMNFGVLGAIAGLFIGYAVAAAAAVLYLNRFIALRFSMPRLSVLKELLSFSFPVFISNLGVSFASGFGVLLLGAYVSASVIGNYGVAFRLASFVIVMLIAINTVLLPTFSYMRTKKSLSRKISSAYSRSLYYTLLFLLPIIAYSASVSTPLVFLLFSSAYALAPLYFIVVSFGMALGIVGSYAGSVVISFGDSRRFMVYQLSVVASEIVLMLILIPLFKVAGLLLVLYLIGPIVLDIIYVIAMFKQFSIRISFGRHLRVVAASFVTLLTMFLFSYSLGQSSPLILINALVLLLLYPPLLLAFRAIGYEELGFIGGVCVSLPLLKPLLIPLVLYTKRIKKIADKLAITS